MRTRISRDLWLERPLRLPETDPFHPWLTDAGSLTARIRARCCRLDVRVLTQRLAQPHPDEAILLGLRAGEVAWLREVLLVADGVPVVYARSILPRHNLRGGWRLFSGIGNRPLGAALFADPRISREPLTCLRLDRRDARYHRALATSGAAATTLWARRSVFRLKRRSLMVCEIFLPAIKTLDR